MLGPVFYWEAIRTGRQRWHWWARILYAGMLLLFLWSAVQNQRFQPGSAIDIQPKVGAWFYSSVSILQLVAVLFLSPVYAANSISDEKTHQTLPFLLSSRLTDVEIIFGKLVLALLRVWEVLLCGLPLCSLCLMLGGVSSDVVLIDFLVAMTAAWASAGLAILAAVWCRRITETIMLVFVLQLLWYVLPLVDLINRTAGGRFDIPREMLALNAFVALSRGSTPGQLGFMHSYGYCLLAMLAFGLACATIAWWRLRPASAKSGDSGAGKWTQRWRILAKRDRPAETVWDDPMLWRELRCRRTSTVDRVVWTVYTIAIVSVLVSLAMTWQSIGRAAPVPVFAIIVVYATMLHLAFLALPYLTVCGATAFAEEKDGEFLDLLRVTLLPAATVFHAKTRRLQRAALLLLAFPVILASLSAAAGMSRWTGCLLSILNLCVVGWFAVMLGMAAGLRFIKSSHAIAVALGLLMAIAVFPPMITSWIAPSDFLPALASPPMHAPFTLVFDSESLIGAQSSFDYVGFRIASAAWTIGYAFVTIFLYWRARRIAFALFSGADRKSGAVQIASRQ